MLDRAIQGCERRDAEITMDIHELNDVVTQYFRQLNDYETYAWIAVLFGFLLVVAGSVLLI